MVFRLTIKTLLGAPHKGSVFLSGVEFLSGRFVQMESLGDGVYEYSGDLFDENEELEIFTNGYKRHLVKNNDVVCLLPGKRHTPRRCSIGSITRYYRDTD